MSHFSEEELIAYHLGESHNASAVRSHVEVCSACGSLSDSIAETLRVFSAEPVPRADFEHNWQRVRGSLSVLPRHERRGWKIFALPALGTLCAALLIAVLFAVHVRHEKQVHYAFDRKGPLTLEPVEEKNHLDAAERLLTVVNHTNGDLDDSTRASAHQLALRNADFVQRAQQRGDLAEAATLDDLGRVLTNIDHQPRSHESGLRLRVEMNTDGLLLDIRILRQNDETL